MGGMTELIGIKAFYLRGRYSTYKIQPLYLSHLGGVKSFLYTPKDGFCCGARRVHLLNIEYGGVDVSRRADSIQVRTIKVAIDSPVVKHKFLVLF